MNEEQEAYMQIGELRCALRMLVAAVERAEKCIGVGLSQCELIDPISAAAHDAALLLQRLGAE